MNPSSIEPAANRPRYGVGFAELFLLFSKIGVSSFGGAVSVWMHRTFVETRGWLTEPEFSTSLALARIMPGVTIMNLAVLIGHRLAGFTGAAAAVMGLVAGPSLIAIGLVILHRRFAGTAILDDGLQGAAAAAAGLLIGMGLKSGSRIVSGGLSSAGRTAGSTGAIVVMATMFVFVGLLRFPTVPTVLCVAPFSLALALFILRDGSTKRQDDGR
jgi:chromate transporter